jgi:hypothetical protein
MGMVAMVLMAGLTLALRFPELYVAVLAARRVVVLSECEMDQIDDLEYNA